ncbi:Dot/Icm T4SS effector [Legionella gratiana]|uniref:Dot/Icm T4SS effector n=2 Tax=Legionella gratiana TaxID=45066 RepID=A0A378JFY7_9GAMM|nr:Dot/Icm T4SS effector [Legionella gratiana]STX45777.1 Dot/Icm T4SS effector [Legionella gratiana]
MKGTAIIQTWGTNSQSKSGEVAKYPEKDLGHASLELRFPATPENLDLIRNYCNSSDKIELGNDDICVVRFSFIPDPFNIGEPFFLNMTYKEDALYAAKIHPDPLFPTCSLTEKGRTLDVNTAEGQYITNQKAIADCQDLMTATIIIIKELNKLKHESKINLQHPECATILKAAKIAHLELPQTKELSAEQLNKLIEDAEFIQHKAVIQLELLVDQKEKFKHVDTFNEDDYLFYGRPADKQVELPIGTGEHELNAVCMLEQMQKIVDSDFKYNEHTHNSASTVLSILNAGSEGKTSELSTIKRLSATLQPAATPQMVYHKALALKDRSCAEEKMRTSTKSTLHQESLIIGLLAAAGLVIGAGIGATLVATGVFAPLGVGVLGLVAVAGTIGGGLSLISGALGFRVTQFTETPTIETRTPKDIGISASQSYLFTSNKLSQTAIERSVYQQNTSLTSMQSEPSIATEYAHNKDLSLNRNRNDSTNQQAELVLADNSDDKTWRPL